MSQQVVPKETLKQTIDIDNVRYEVCECCGKPKRGTGKSLGGVAVFVCKDFIKAGKRTPFSQQWAELCIAVGFEPYAYFRAWQVKPGPVQTALIGDDKDYTKEYKSFFRRLHEKKNPAISVDWEDVLVFRKGESNA